jgi:hypothetical protein
MVIETSAVIEGHILSIGYKLAVSFQRYPEQMLRGNSETPQSYGALPIELSSASRGLVPTGYGEGVWLGLSSQGGKPCPIRVDWLGAQGSEHAVLPWFGLVSSPHRLYALQAFDGSFCPFIRFPSPEGFLPCSGIMISIENDLTIEVRFVSATEFESRTHRVAPRPMSLDDCYGGWPLP